MFSTIKNWLRGGKQAHTDLSLLSDLHMGYSIGFGFMPQALLSGKRFSISGVHSYRFDDQRFVSYQLSHASLSTPIQMILQLEGEDSYLAISMRLDADDQKAFFGRALENRDSVFMQDKLVLNPTDSQRLDGWFTGTYHKVLDGIRGEWLEGHHQLSGKDKPAQAFAYYLFADEANEHAIEMERYDHGEFRIYATVFRPITDIGQVRKPETMVTPKAESDKSVLQLVSSMKPIEQVRVEPVIEKLHPEFFDTEKLIHVAPAAPRPVVIHPKTVPQETPKREPVSPQAPRQAASKSAPRKSEVALNCSTALVSKLLTESERSEIALSQLVRKVIGLPVQYHETLILPLKLSEAEMESVGKKLNVDPHDSKALDRAIVRELELFAGVDIEEVA